MKEYTTERGVTIGVVPIPLLLGKIRESHPEPPAPTYTEHIAGGATQEVTITAEMAAAWMTQNPDGWAEHAGAWTAYQEKLDERTKVLNDALWRAVMRRAIVVTPPVDEAWIREQNDLGITVPPEGQERREHYIWTEVIGGQADIIRVMGLAAGADFTEEQLATIEASFWDTIQRPAAR
jgi:hypothetical protein